MSMIGFVRRLCRYAVPRSGMNVAGECVGRAAFGRSCPRGETAPPITLISGETAFSAS